MNIPVFFFPFVSNNSFSREIHRFILPWRQGTLAFSWETHRYRRKAGEAKIYQAGEMAVVDVEVQEAVEIQEVEIKIY